MKGLMQFTALVSLGINIVFMLWLVREGHEYLAFLPAFAAACGANWLLDQAVKK